MEAAGVGWKLTVGDGHHDPAHELRLLHVGILPVQQHARGADLARGAVEAVEFVGGTDAVHHRAVLPQVWVDSHHLPWENSTELQERSYYRN